MPELPEVETLRRALLPLVLNKRVVAVRFFRPDLRFAIPRKEIERHLTGKTVDDITRVGKYLLLHADSGAMLWHLGMSGRVTQRPAPERVDKHTHAVFQIEPDTYLHFVDPRRFGCILWIPKGESHKLIEPLGPDPFSPELTPQGLKQRARTCKGPIKNFIMNAHRIAGVGNIYACEALFECGIRPSRPANRLTLAEWESLLEALRATLTKSIAAGGTTLRDFFNTDGTPGYFATDLAVYGREGEPCRRCQTPIVRKFRTGRSTFHCKVCQRK